MEQYVIFVLCAVLFTAVSPEPPYPWVTKQYRTDYEYNRRTDAFYKLHIENRPSGTVADVCRVEGAQLMSPSSENDIIQLHSMFKKFPDLGEYVRVADDGLNHESAEEQPLIDLNSDDPMIPMRSGRGCLVVTRAGDIESTLCFRQLPFICKVNAKDAPYDTHCGVFGKDYKYFASVRSCYKIPRIVYTWSEAYSECLAEGAHLVVLNSETEREVVQNLTNTEAPLMGTRASWFFFAGFRADQPPEAATNVTRVFKTVFNQTLEQAGFSQWSDNEPNNALGREYCGSIFKNDGKLNDVDCSHGYAFICEKEVPRTKQL